MIPKFRAYDGGSLCRMYSPEEVMVDNGDIWIIDEDGVAGEWIVNNDLVLMQSTGLTDKNGKEIFEGDVVTDGYTTGDIKKHPTLGFYMVGDNGTERWFSDNATIEDFEEDVETAHKILEIIGNIYKNPELVEVSS